MLGGLFGRLFGAPEAVKGVVDGVTNGLDALIYTDEEKAGDAAADRSEARKMVVSWMAATSGQNIARRLIALAITGVWLMMYLTSVFTQMVGVWWLGKAEQLTATAKIALAAATDMNGAVMLILAFYFAAPHMGDIASAAINRFQQRTGGDEVKPNRVG